MVPGQKSSRRMSTTKWFLEQGGSREVYQSHPWRRLDEGARTTTCGGWREAFLLEIRGRLNDEEPQITTKVLLKHAQNSKRHFIRFKILSSCCLWQILQVPHAPELHTPDEHYNYVEKTKMKLPSTTTPSKNPQSCFDNYSKKTHKKLPLQLWCVHLR